MSAQTLDADECDCARVAAIQCAIVPTASLSLAQICAKSPSKVPSVVSLENIFFANLHRNLSTLGLRCDFRGDHATSIHNMGSTQ
jgi:hypothetical protein